MSGTDGSRELQWMLDTMRSMPGLPKAVAPSVADAVRDSLKSTAKSGTDPDGKAWIAKEDGGRPMVDAADAVHVAAVGTRILCVVKGPEARHDKGTARGGKRRSIIPKSSRIPAGIDTAVRAVLDEEFKRRTTL